MSYVGDSSGHIEVGAIVIMLLLLPLLLSSAVKPSLTSHHTALHPSRHKWIFFQKTADEAYNFSGCMPVEPTSNHVLIVSLEFNLSIKPIALP